MIAIIALLFAENIVTVPLVTATNYDLNSVYSNLAKNTPRGFQSRGHARRVVYSRASTLPAGSVDLPFYVEDTIVSGYPPPYAFLYPLK